MTRRVKLEAGQQKLFINYVMRKLNCSLRGMLKYNVGVSYPSLKKYRQEKCLMPNLFFEKLCKLASINKNSLNVIYLDSNWGKVKGGSKGIVSMRKKHLSKIKGWCLKGGKFSSCSNIKKIKHPRISKELAELIGAIIGDGTITSRFVRISGDYRYDMSYFNYLSGIVNKLFGITASIYQEKSRYKNTAYLLISSKRFCSFLYDHYGLKFGDKIRNNTIIPAVILKKKALSIACLRGLMDTDGSVSRRGRNGSQFCVEFFSKNFNLVKQVDEIGKRLGIFTYIARNRVGTNSWKYVSRYFKIVGSSNLKHIIRFHLRYSQHKSIYVGDVPEYAKKDLYRNLRLPYRLDP